MSYIVTQKAHFPAQLFFVLLISWSFSLYKMLIEIFKRVVVQCFRGHLKKDKKKLDMAALLASST